MVYTALISAYFLGAIPFGYITTMYLKKIDIRRHGSGNIGATNVLRLMGWRAAILVLFLDAGKGAAAVLVARAISDQLPVQMAAALLALIGHSFPVFLGFRGGKGAATSIGVLIPLAGWVTLLLLFVVGAVTAVTRYVSLGSISGALALPLLFYLSGYDLTYVCFGAAVAILVVARHHSNIRRLLKGTEPKIGQKSKLPGEKKG